MTELRWNWLNGDNYLCCLSCYQRKVRKDDRVVAPSYRWRCRACGKGWAYTPLADGETSILKNQRRLPVPLPIELDADWSTV